MLLAFAQVLVCFGAMIARAAGFNWSHRDQNLLPAWGPADSGNCRSLKVSAADGRQAGSVEVGFLQIFSGGWDRLGLAGTGQGGH